MSLSFIVALICMTALVGTVGKGKPPKPDNTLSLFEFDITDGPSVTDSSPLQFRIDPDKWKHPRSWDVHIAENDIVGDRPFYEFQWDPEGNGQGYVDYLARFSDTVWVVVFRTNTGQYWVRGSCREREPDDTLDVYFQDDTWYVTFVEAPVKDRDTGDDYGTASFSFTLRKED